MKNLTEGNIYKNFLLFSIPMILSSVLSQLTDTINTIVAGIYLQEEGLAATGATKALNTFVNSLFWGYNMGFSVYIAKLFGAGRYEKLKGAMYDNILLLAATIAAISVLLIVFRHPIYKMLNVDPAIVQETDRYFTIVTAGRIFPILNNGYICVLTAMGGSIFPLVISLIFAVLRICGNILSIKVLDLGVAGIAWTSLLCSAMATAVYHIRFKANLKKLGVHKARVTIRLREMKDAFGHSLPVCAQQGILYFIGLILSSVINSLGVAATAGYVMVQQVYDLSAVLFTNASKTVSNYAAQAAGAGKYKEIQKGLKIGALQGLILTVPVVLITVIFAEPICGVFLPESGGGKALEYAILFARYYAPFILVYMFCNLFHSFFRGVAKMKSLLTATIAASVIRLLASIVCVRFWGMEGIFIGWVFSWVADLAICIFCYLRKCRTPELLRQNIKSVAATK